MHYNKNVQIKYEQAALSRFCGSSTSLVIACDTDLGPMVKLLLILYLQWTPDGRRVLTGNSNGEMTVWNGLMGNFVTISQV